jgi:hypothetical protein
LLISENIHRLTIQAIRVPVDDIEILLVPHLPFEVSKPGERSSLQKRGTILIHSIEAVK